MYSRLISLKRSIRSNFSFIKNNINLSIHTPSPIHKPDNLSSLIHEFKINPDFTSILHKYKLNKYFDDDLISDFTPPDFILYIIENYNYIIHIHAKLDKYEIKWNLYSKFTKINQKTYDWLHNLISFSFSIIKYFKIYKNFEINLIPTPFKKQFNNEKVINPDMVNSGFSLISDYLGSKIYVFRKEELEKVLFHELIHVLGVTSKIKYSFDNSSIIKFVKHKINYNENQILLDETFTDFLAIIFYIIYHSLVLNNPTKIKFILDDLTEYIIDRGSYLYYKYKNNWNETTNGLAYYVLKAILFNDIEFYGNYIFDCLENKEIDVEKFDIKFGMDIHKMEFIKNKDSVLKTKSLKMVNL